jgi:hypothetical protein
MESPEVLPGRAQALRSNSFHPRRGERRDVVVVVVEIEPTNRPCPSDMVVMLQWVRVATSCWW